MFEVKVYDSLSDLIDDNKTWFDQKFPFEVRSIEDGSEESGDEETIDGVMKYIEEQCCNWKKFVVARKKPNEKFDLDEEEILLAILKCPKLKLEKFISKIKKLGEDFILDRERHILVLDNRGFVAGCFEGFFENQDVLYDYSKEQDEKFKSLKIDQICELYEKYQKDCIEFGESFHPSQSKKSSINLRKNIMQM